MKTLNFMGLIAIWIFVAIGAMVICETRTDLYQTFLVGVMLTGCWAAAEGIEAICDKAVEKYAKKEYYIKW